MLQNLLFFQVVRFETAHMGSERTDFRLVEPVGETALPEVHQLAVQSRVVQRMVVGTENILYLERKPAAIARDVRQEVAVIARTAERGDVRSYLLVGSIHGTFHHLRHRYDGFHLLHLPVRHGRDFFQADEPGFRQLDAVVLLYLAVVGFRHIVATQFGR